MLLAAAIGSAGALVPVTATASPGVAPRAALAADDPVDDGSVSEEDRALEKAKSTGSPAELMSARTEVSDTWAQPDGSFSVKRYGSPIRLFRDGAWVATDPSLTFAADGTVVPRASTVSVAFSGGGTGPLLSGVKDGRTLTLSWPTELPTPVLTENVATYSEVLPGVDLQLKAEVEGFSQLFVVKTAEAARNPELATLTYKMKTVGLTVSADAESGSLAAVDPAGQTVFTSPTPLMWDSRTDSSTPAARSATVAGEGSAAGDIFEPPPGAADAQMPTTVSGDSIEIKPDQALLTGSATTYPVYIDPSWAWGKKENWTRVYKKYPKSSFWNANEVARVGYENETNGLSRSFFQVDTDSIKGAEVKSSTFRIKNVWSWSCQDRPVEIWQTKAISKKTTWNNQPAKVGTSPLKTVNESKGWSKDCAAGNLEFDVTAKAREAAAGKWSSLTLGLYAENESDTFGWKKFDAKTAVLETEYNNPPNAPSGLGTNPKTSCSAGGLIGNTQVSLFATIDDPDAGNLSAQFQVFRSGSSTPVIDRSIGALKGRVATLPTTDALIPTGDYTWKVRAEDAQKATSGWSPTCKFSVDRTRPGTPPTISSLDGKFPSGENGWPSTTGKAREEGKFGFAPNGVTDVDHYVWWSSSAPELNDVLPGVPVTVRAPGYGAHFIYAYSVDKAGNQSDTATYIFYATRSAARDAPGDLNGDGSKDIWSVDSNGTLLTYSGRQNGEFSSATNGGQAFDDASITYRTDWGQDGYTDLVTLEYDPALKRKVLWTYTNNGLGIATTNYKEGKQPLTVKCPVVDEDSGCFGEPGWTGNDHWSDAGQVIAPGDINADGRPDLLVQQGKLLWAYFGGYTKRLSPPVLVGGDDWDKFTVLAPGDLNNDGLADLWLRNKATGDILRTYGSEGPNGILDPTAWGGTTARVKIAGGFPASTYPTLGTVGDLTGDGMADLWARKSDNTMTGWPGKVTGSEFSFGAAFPIDGAVGGIRIPAGTTLTGGQSYISRSAELTMKDDGDLEITSNAGKRLWSTKTAGNVGAMAVMQTKGNLVVYKADGTTVLWDSKTSGAEGYAVLQDRGNLVIHNAKGQSLWSSGTALRHDYNSDGRSDMADWYDHTDKSDTIHSFPTNSDGTFRNPLTGWNVPADSWAVSRMKRTTGDYNGDGIGDVAAVYGYDDGRVALWTWLGNTQGNFAAPFVSWQVPAGNWSFKRMTLSSGDFNSDGRDDVSVWYDYADGRDALWTFTADVRGGFNAPFSSWSSPSGNWTSSRDKQVTGDFNGDGRDDLAVFHGYSDGSNKIFTFLAAPTGGFTYPVGSWTSTSWGDWNRTTVHAGDFDGDGRDDIAAWYDYADGHDSIYTFPSSATGTFGSVAEAWTTPAGAMWRDHMSIVIGDYNGDGMDDFGALYGYDDGTIRAWTWSAQANRTFAKPVSSWEALTGYSFARSYAVERYGS
ncbi:FG-GAP-like repeat-containing protein [Streptomyces sp. NBC_00654]|uniref:FG-GAP-like repeat-containing protein n=1 Tax=Streptomyces sp. NBC_00654 TaxID=2975799 RepID=UPI002258D095|nr:FG-GAP-like repeat-containing protein [Streptomyces sp. NBC_00654]MCX4964400.1 FG-GAP-like repeat-containing protein [Streptomyces sp. NBC_00654]